MITSLECRTLNRSVGQHKKSEPELVVQKPTGPIQETMSSREYLESSNLVHTANDHKICEFENKALTPTCAAENKLGLRHSLMDNNDGNVVPSTDKLQPTETEADPVQPTGKQNKHYSSVTSKSGAACTICHLQCVNQWHLKDHMLSHTGEEVYKCSVCEKQFSRKYDVKCHMLRHTKYIQREPLKHRNINGSLKDKHQKREFGTNFPDVKYITAKAEIVTKSANSQLTCTICALQWQSRKNLKSHMLIHMGDETSDCTICGRPFRRMYDLNRHMLFVHSKTLPKSSRKSELKAYTHGTKNSEPERLVLKPTGPIQETMSSREYLEDSNLVHTANDHNICEFENKALTPTCAAENKLGLRHSLMDNNDGNVVPSTDKLQPTETEADPVQPTGKQNKHYSSETSKSGAACTICHLQCVNQWHLKDHMLSHTGEEVYKCSVCEKQFSRKYDVKRHMLRHTKYIQREPLKHRNINGSLKDKQQKREFGTNFPDVKHITAKAEIVTKSANSQLTCTICALQWQSRKNLESHMLIHMGEKTSDCTICERPFRRIYDLNRHMFHVHNKTVPKSSRKTELKRLTHDTKTIQKRPQNEQVSSMCPDSQALTKTTVSKGRVKCDICTKQFQKMAILERHMRCHFAERPYVCSVCGEKFKSERELDRHTWIHSEETDFLCHVCGKQFTCCQKLKRHMVVHTGAREHSCDVCGKNFIWAANLWAHKQSHYQHTPYICDLCNKTFKRRNNIRTHIRLTHFGVKQHKCSVCSKDFVTKSHLTDHMKIHSGSRPYKCEICEKGFARPGHLKKHSRLHTGETPFSCKTCYQQFKRAENLKVHMLIHAGVKPHACEVCGQRFRQKSSMKKHKLRHTTVEQLGERNKPFLPGNP